MFPHPMTRIAMNLRILVLLICSLAFSTYAQEAQSSSQSELSSHQSLQVKIPASSDWTDTNLDVHAGDTLSISLATPAKDCPLYARIGPTGQPLKLDTTPSFKTASDGRLFLGSNTVGKTCTTELSAQVQVTPGKAGMTLQQKLTSAAQTWLSGQFGSPSPTGTQSNSAAGGSTPSTPGPVEQVANLVLSNTPLDPALTQQIEGLPRRVNDEFNHEGDMVNFILVGAQEETQKTLANADWHLADVNNAQAIVNAVLQTYNNEDYKAMPMSQLQLFGRVQDFGYEQADPFAVVASRHHFRLWKAPFDYKGQPVWVGAGTHDVGFEKDQRNGKVTHKIDPNVDGERDHIAATLQKAGKVKSMGYYLPSNPVQEARNATGGGYQSDGKIMVIFLK